MTERYQKLKRKLKELFQLDRPELDFGIYRIMHARSAGISPFLDENLLPQARDAYYSDGDFLSKRVYKAAGLVRWIAEARGRRRGRARQREGLRRPEDTWRVKSIEEDFHRLMFAESTP